MAELSLMTPAESSVIPLHPPLPQVGVLIGMQEKASAEWQNSRRWRLTTWRSSSAASHVAFSTRLCNTCRRAKEMINP